MGLDYICGTQTKHTGMIDFEGSVPLPRLVKEERSRLERWIRRVAAGYGYTVGNIHYVLCDDEQEWAVNRQFLGHDYYTDIITFSYSTPTTLSGDIFISLDMVHDNARSLQVDEEEELRRILIHGVLHLTGQEDKTPDTRAEMTRKEDAALDLW